MSVDYMQLALIDFGELLHYILDDLHCTLSTLAEYAGYKSKKSICHYFSGERSPSFEVRARILYNVLLKTGIDYSTAVNTLYEQHLEKVMEVIQR